MPYYFGIVHFHVQQKTRIWWPSCFFVRGGSLSPIMTTDQKHCQKQLNDRILMIVSNMWSMQYKTYSMSWSFDLISISPYMEWIIIFLIWWSAAMSCFVFRTSILCSLCSHLSGSKTWHSEAVRPSLALSDISTNYWGREEDLDIEYSLVFQQNISSMLARCLRRWFNINST